MPAHRPTDRTPRAGRAVRGVSLIILVASALVAALSTACTDGGRHAVDGPVAQSLIERWSDVAVVNAQPAPTLPPSFEISFAEGAPAGITWQVMQGIEDLRIEDGKLVGRTTSDAPVLLFESAEAIGSGDELWSAVTRLQASQGTRMGVHTVLDGPPLPAQVARIEEWPMSSPLLPGTEAQTYRVEVDDVFLLEMMPGLRSPRQILFRPSNEAGTDFALESLRLVFRQEHFAGIASGPGWHGLGEVFREALISRTPETLVFRESLPARPILTLAVGSVERSVPTFRVAISEVSGSAAEEPETVAEIRPEEPETWQMHRVDLSEWAGKTVEIRLSAKAAEGSEEKGALAFWGAPTIRNTSSAQQKAERPQAVVVFLADTLRRDHLSAWGHERETAPAISRLASEGVVFGDTIAQSTWTKVSVSSILTSLYPSTSGVAGLSDRVSAGETTLAEVFRDSGYATFATSSVPFSGMLTNLHQGVEVLHEFGSVPREGGEYQSKTSRHWVDQYLAWLEQHRDVPTFAFVHVMDPHSPFRPEEPYDTLWATPEDAERFAQQADQVRPFIDSPLGQRFMAPTSEHLAAAGVDAESFVTHEKNWYDGSIRAMDVEIERMMEQLDALGVADGTLLAFVSDHGEGFLEHGLHWHGQTVYGEVTNVPMMLWGRGVPAGVEVDERVETIDLYPTLLDLAGLETPERVQGDSLRPLFDASAGEMGRSKPVFTELPDDGRPGESPHHAIYEGQWKLIWNREAPEDVAEFELFDAAADPLDQNDLAAENPEVVERLSAEIQRWRSWAESQQLDESEAMSAMSAEELEQLRSLGYVD